MRLRRLSDSGLTWSSVPASPVAAGTAGQIAYDGSYVYVCTTSNVWRRTLLTAWDVPTAIPGLQLWLDASDASTLYDATSGGSLVAADGAVARWEDRSGNGRHVIQATSGSRPLRKASVQGGKDVLRFDGSDDWVYVPNSTDTFKFLHGADSTVFAVVKSGQNSNPGQGGYFILATHNGTSAETGVQLATADSDPSTANDYMNWFLTRGELNSYPAFLGANNFFPSGVFGVVSVISKPTDATASNRVAFRRNGGTAVTNSVGQGTQTVSTGNSTGNLTFGATASGSAAFLSGDIAEVCIYNAALSNADRAVVESYLMTKWGIT